MHRVDDHHLLEDTGSDEITENRGKKSRERESECERAERKEREKETCT